MDPYCLPFIINNMSFGIVAFGKAFTVSLSIIGCRCTYVHDCVSENDLFISSYLKKVARLANITHYIYYTLYTRQTT